MLRSQFCPYLYAEDEKRYFRENSGPQPVTEVALPTSSRTPNASGTAKGKVVNKSRSKKSSQKKVETFHPIVYIYIDSDIAIDGESRQTDKHISEAYRRRFENSRISKAN